MQRLLVPFFAFIMGAVFVAFVHAPKAEAQSAVSGSRYVAVASEYMTGVSLLYVIDQETSRLAVYEGRGGAPNSRELVLVGVRNISLDVQLDGFNDESDYKYQELLERFERNASAEAQD